METEENDRANDAEDSPDSEDLDESYASDEWVTLTHYHSPADAHMDRLNLEGQGIACELLDEQVSTIAPLYSFATGGIRLQVPKSQLADAMKLVGDQWKTEQKEQITCPQCGKENIIRLDLEFPQVLFTVIKFFGLFLIGIVVPFYYKVPMRCRDCSHTWKIRSRIFSRWKAKN